MIRRHPFEWISDSAQGRVFISLFIFTVGLLVLMNVIGGALINDVSPSGIISFEFAGDLTNAQQMIEAWGPSGRISAGLSLGLDYLFMVAYSGSIGLGCILVARNYSNRHGFPFMVGVVLAWAQYGAALLDAIENYALIRVLFGAQQELWPIVAKWCATPKFMFVAGGLGYILIGAVLIIVKKYFIGKNNPIL